MIGQTSLLLLRETGSWWRQLLTSCRDGRAEPTAPTSRLAEWQTGRSVVQLIAQTTEGCPLSLPTRTSRRLLAAAGILRYTQLYLSILSRPPTSPPTAVETTTHDVEVDIVPFGLADWQASGGQECQPCLFGHSSETRRGRAHNWYVSIQTSTP